MLRKIVSSLLLVVVPATLAFENCSSNEVLSPHQPYEIEDADGLLFCPDTNGMTWTFTSCEMPPSDSCTTGTFSFDGQFSSDSESCFQESSGQACVQTKDGRSTLAVCVSGLTSVSVSGRLELVYTPNGGSPRQFTVDYAPIGISLLMDSDEINVVVGSPAQISWRVRQLPLMNEQYAIFYVTSNGEQYLFGNVMTDSSSNNLTGIVLRDIQPCTTSLENQVPSDYVLEFESVSMEHSGVYRLEVVIGNNANENISETSEVTLNVLPSSPIPTSTSGPPASAVMASSVSPSATGSPMDDIIGSSLLIVIGVSVVVVVGLIAATLIVVLVTCFLRKKQSSHLPESGRVAMSNGSTNPTFKKRISVDVGPEKRPLVNATTPSPGTTPTTKTANDFVGLLYDEEYAISYSILNGKYPELITKLPDVDNMIWALGHQPCKEIIVIVNLRTSPVFREMNSRAIPKDGREKVKFVQFGKDSTPGYNVEAQGYRVVVLDGDPQEEETFDQLLTKLEQPVYHQVASPAHGRMNSEPASLPTLDERPQQSRPEVDRTTAANDRKPSSDPAVLPTEEMRKFYELEKAKLEIEKARLEESKKSTKLLEDINRNASSISRNTGGIQDALESAVVNGGAASTPPP